MNWEIWTFIIMLAMFPCVAGIAVFTIWRWLIARRRAEQDEQWKRDWYITGVYAGRGGAQIPQRFGVDVERRQGDPWAGAPPDEAEAAIHRAVNEMYQKGAPEVADINSAEKVPDRTPDAPVDKRPLGS